jgi:hypothetical protein
MGSPTIPRFAWSGFSARARRCGGRAVPLGHVRSHASPICKGDCKDQTEPPWRRAVDPTPVCRALPSGRHRRPLPNPPGAPAAFAAGATLMPARPSPPASSPNPLPRQRITGCASRIQVHPADQSVPSLWRKIPPPPLHSMGRALLGRERFDRRSRMSGAGSSTLNTPPNAKTLQKSLPAVAPRVGRRARREGPYSVRRSNGESGR